MLEPLPPPSEKRMPLTVPLPLPPMLSPPMTFCVKSCTSVEPVLQRMPETALPVAVLVPLIPSPVMVLPVRVSETGPPPFE